MAMVAVMFKMKGGQHNSIEDKIAIYELIVSHPPSADKGHDDYPFCRPAPYRSAERCRSGMRRSLK